MKALLLYPQYPDTFWGFKYALRFIAKKASQPPLGLITIAAMLPKSWELKLIDTNVEKLKTKHIEWADIIFISAMSIQKWTAKEIIAKCKMQNKIVVAGGPLFSSEPNCFPEVDHLFINESERTMPQFLLDFEQGSAKPIYESQEFPELTETLTPRWDLIKSKKYALMNVQYSRGCPYDCEFCSISSLNGRKVRTKTGDDIFNELDAIYASGWTGDVFFVDDNFIGNKKKLKTDILPRLEKWMISHKFPFAFSTEVSINISDDSELMKMLVASGFDSVFVGIETPNEEALIECNKVQNQNRDMILSIHKIQESGLQVTGGFILGFDSDQPTIFEKLVNFVKQSDIISAMIGLLNAPINTALYERMKNENRLTSVGNTTGNNTDFIINFKPKMNLETLVEGYKKALRELYTPKEYYARIRRFMRRWRPNPRAKAKFSFRRLNAFFKSMIKLGIIGKERKQYWKLFFWTIFTRPRQLPQAVSFAIYGFHFRKYFKI